MCSVCKQEVKDGERFAAKKTDDVWEVQHERCMDPRTEFASLPRFFMTAARLWVLTK